MQLTMVLSLPRDEATVRLARRALASFLAQLGVSLESIHDIEVAISEACTNVIKHAEHGEEYEVSLEVNDHLTRRAMSASVVRSPRCTARFSACAGSTPVTSSSGTTAERRPTSDSRATRARATSLHGGRTRRTRSRFTSTLKWATSTPVSRSS